MESVSSLVENLLSLTLQGMAVMSMTSILEVSVGALESKLSSQNTWRGKFASQIALEISRSDEDAAELLSTERCFRLVEVTISVIQELV